MRSLLFSLTLVPFNYQNDLLAISCVHELVILSKIANMYFFDANIYCTKSALCIYPVYDIFCITCRSNIIFCHFSFNIFYFFDISKNNSFTTFSVKL